MSGGIGLRADPLACDGPLLQLLSTGFALSAVIATAVELEVFDRLAEAPAGAADLATRLQTSSRGTERLLTALTALGLLRRDEDGRFHNLALASQLLVAASPDQVRALLLHQERHFAPLFAHLTSAVRSGAPQTQRWRFATDGDDSCYAALERDPAELELFVAAMDAASRGVGTLIARQADLGAARRLLDLGGGGGQVACEIAAALPALTVELVDSEPVCAHARRRVRAAGLDARVRCIAGDVFAADLPGLVDAADAVLFSGVLCDWSPDERAHLLGNARRLLRPRGALLVSETLMNDGRTGPLLPALLSLCMLLGTRGDNLTFAELSSELERAGFTDARVHRNGALGLRDLITARRAD